MKYLTPSDILNLNGDYSAVHLTIHYRKDKKGEYECGGFSNFKIIQKSDWIEVQWSCDDCDPRIELNYKNTPIKEIEDNRDWEFAYSLWINNMC